MSVLTASALWNEGGRTVCLFIPVEDFSTRSAFSLHTYLVVESVYHPEQQPLFGPHLRCGQYVVHVMAKLLPPAEKTEPQHHSQRRPNPSITHKPCMHSNNSQTNTGPKHWMYLVTLAGLIKREGSCLGIGMLPGPWCVCVWIMASGGFLPCSNSQFVMCH